MTNATSATFKYSDSTASGYTFTRFMCSLDGAAYAACGTTLTGSTESYTGLSSTSHTFKVEAVYGSTTTAAASYSWTVDTTPPKVLSINLAAGARNPTNTGPLSWTVTFSEPVTGVAAGDFGLVKSSVFGTAPSISGLSGSGAVYTVTVSTTGTTGSDSGSIGLNLTSKGSIADLAGNALSATLPVVGQSYTFDTEAPPAPGIFSEPSATTTSTSASFTFCDDSDNDGDTGCSDPDDLADAVLYCSLDSTTTYTICTSPVSYSGLALGSHTFRVYAVDLAGNVSPTTSYTWTVSKASPSISTALSAGTVPVGSGVYDTASLSGKTANAGGSVTYSYYSNNTCTAGATSVNTVTVTNGAVPASSTVTFTSPTTAYWRAVYTGDSNNNGASSPCTASSNEQLTVTKASTGITTTPSAGVTVGGSVSDSATLTGSYHATGSIVFSLYSNAGCSTQVYTSSGGLSGTSATSGPYSTVAAGVYYWKASYAGDPDNTSFTTPCGSAGETVSVAKASPTLSTSATQRVTLGGSISDTATLNGLEYPDGEGFVAFGLFTNQYCLGLPLYVSAAAESNGTVSSGTYKPTAPGSYYWAAVYTGDGNNNPTIEFCGGTNETSVVTAAALQPLTISGNAAGPLYPLSPGATPTNIPVEFTNPNSVAVTVTSFTISASGYPAGCSPDLLVGYGATPISGTNTLTVPANSSITLPSGTVTEPTILMQDSGNQSSCTGSFTLSYADADNGSGTGTGSGTATFGSSGPFTVAIAPAAGNGLLLPTALGDPNATIDTVDVTVTNTGGGDENLNQLVYEVTPGWTASLAGHPDCVAADFSIDGHGDSYTVSPDNDLAPGGQATYSFTIQMIDNHADQDACAGQKPSITVNAS